MASDPKLKITVWMNHPSHHQDDLFSALARLEDVDFQVVFAKDMTADRAELGWARWNTGFPSRLLEKPVVRNAVRLTWRQRDRWHVVNGIWAEPAFAAALATLRSCRGGRYAIYSEAPDATVPRRIRTQIVQRSFGRWIAQGAAGLLAVSHLAEGFYRDIGFAPHRMYKFGYFLSGEVAIPDRADAGSDGTEILFVGQMIPRKGVDLLLDAIAPLFDARADLHLTLIGGGPDAAKLEASAVAAGVAERVTFAGVVPADQVRRRIAAADLLVLPSRWDGWGLAVNEALSVGVPVLVSDRCGAADIVRHGANGYVFRSEDVADLRARLAEFAARTTPRASMRAAARATGNRLAAEVVAPYLVECVRHMAGHREARPTPPWLA